MGSNPISSAKKSHPVGVALFGGKAGFEEGGIANADANNMPVACYLARGKIPRNMDASHRDVDMVRVCKMTSNISVGLLGDQYSSFPCNLLSI